MQSYRIVVTDDFPILRNILKDILLSNSEMEVVGEAGDGLALLRLLHGMPLLPNLVLLDISMPKLNGIDAAREVSRRFPGVKILMMTASREMEYVAQAFAAGASGYLRKEDIVGELFDAIKVIREGGKYGSQGWIRGSAWQPAPALLRA